MFITIKSNRNQICCLGKPKARFSDFKIASFFVVARYDDDAPMGSSDDEGKEKKDDAKDGKDEKKEEKKDEKKLAQHENSPPKSSLMYDNVNNLWRSFD